MLIGLRRLCSRLGRRPPTSKRDFAPSLKALPAGLRGANGAGTRATRSRRPPAIATAAVTASNVVVYDGKARTFGTQDEAREGKRIAHRQAKFSKARAAGVHRDEPHDKCPDCERERQAREGAEPLLHDYSREVIARYIGTGRRGYREETRDEDRRLLERYALAYFAPDVRLRDVARCRSPSSSAGSAGSRAGAAGRWPTARCETRSSRCGSCSPPPGVRA